jgi:glucokinase
MTEVLAGIDIGGTKCAIVLGVVGSDGITIIAKQRFPTPSDPETTLQCFTEELKTLLQEDNRQLTGIGISCGGPLSAQKGIILSPPNLPSWNDIAVVDYFQTRFNVPTALQNDANAGALAEWLWGAGRGYKNLIFMTFGTGMGAGLILDGRLYSGTNDLAGEAGHIRLADDGPVGFGKAGSFEGFCSGGGIQRMAVSRVEVALKNNNPPSFCPTLADLDQISAKSVAEAAHQGDKLALEIFDTVAQRLGLGLSILIDILNPQRIILGSIYLRQRDLLDEKMQEIMKQEAISYSAAVCDIVPPGLGEAIGDYSALAIAQYQFDGS